MLPTSLRSAYPSSGLVLCVALLALCPDFVLPAKAAPTRNEDRVSALLAQMTLEEKIGQMTQADSNALKDKADIQKYFLGSVLSGGDSDPPDNSPLAQTGSGMQVLGPQDQAADPFTLRR